MSNDVDSTAVSEFSDKLRLMTGCAAPYAPVITAGARKLITFTVWRVMGNESPAQRIEQGRAVGEV